MPKKEGDILLMHARWNLKVGEQLEALQVVELLYTSTLQATQNES